jgi:hypothetical protein
MMTHGVKWGATSGFRTTSADPVVSGTGAHRVTSAVPENRMTPAPLATVRGLIETPGGSDMTSVPMAVKTCEVEA